MRLMSSLKSSSHPGGQAHVAIGDASAAALQRRAHGLLADPGAEVLVEVEQVAEQAGQPRVAVVADRLLDGGHARLVDALAGSSSDFANDGARVSMNTQPRSRPVPWSPM